MRSSASAAAMAAMTLSIRRGAGADAFVPVSTSVHRRRDGRFKSNGERKTAQTTTTGDRLPVLRMSFTPPPLPDSKDPFALLGLFSQFSPDTKEIKRAYKRMARQYHPDVVVDKDSTDEDKKRANDNFARINAAYETLKDGNSEQSMELQQPASDDADADATNGGDGDHEDFSSPNGEWAQPHPMWEDVQPFAAGGGLEDWARHAGEAYPHFSSPHGHETEGQPSTASTSGEQWWQKPNEQSIHRPPPPPGAELYDHPWYERESGMHFYAGGGHAPTWEELSTLNFAFADSEHDDTVAHNFRRYDAAGVESFFAGRAGNQVSDFFASVSSEFDRKFDAASASFEAIFSDFAGGTTARSRHDDHASFEALLRVSTFDDVAIAMGDAVKSSIELEEKVTSLDLEMMGAQRYGERERIADLRARKEVASRYLQRARTRVAKLRERYEELMVEERGGMGYDSAYSSKSQGYRDGRFRSTTSFYESHSSTAAAPSSSSAQSKPNGPFWTGGERDSSWKHELFSFGRRRGRPASALSESTQDSHEKSAYVQSLADNVERVVSQTLKNASDLADLKEELEIAVQINGESEFADDMMRQINGSIASLVASVQKLSESSDPSSKHEMSDQTIFRSDEDLLAQVFEKRKELRELREQVKHYSLRP